MPSKADSDVWMKDCKDHCEYICTWIDDLLYAGHNGKAFYDALHKLKYQLKGVSETTYHLSGNFKRVTEPESMLTWGAQIYVKRMMASYEQLFGEPVPKLEVHAQLEPGDHPEIDDSPLLGFEDIKKYWQMIGEMQWAVSLGQTDIIAATMTMARFRSAPRQGHLKHLKHIYCFLCNYKKTTNKFNTEMPDYSNDKDEKKNQGYIYHL
eukprot:1946684-Ditylum_brightwellii.AAC.1